MKKILIHLPSIIKYILFVVALTPIIYTRQTFYPYILGKTVFFRSLVEVALLVSLFYVVIKIFSGKIVNGFAVNKNFFKSRLFVILVLFCLSVVLSTIFAVDKYTAFWGTLERAGGLFGWLHYFVFLILGLTFFNRKDWAIFLKISSIVGFIIIFYGFLQYFGVKEFPFALSELVERPGSFVGNPSFLSAYLLFVIGIAILIFNLEKILFWRVFSIFLAFISVVMIFLAATRGALLGFGVGIIVLLVYYVFAGSRALGTSRKNIRVFSIIALFAILGFLTVFWMTRFAPFWQNVPGLNRFSKITSLVPNDSSTQTRLISWHMGLEAFKAKPILGWGPDNYLLAWNRHYDPKLAIYGETWLDRAHNELIDLLVMQGALGLLIYIVLFGTILYLLFFRKPFSFISPILGSVFVAYFVQNLFLFDETSSYLLFFAVIGFLIKIISEPVSADDFREEALKENQKNVSPIGKYSIAIFVVGLGALIIYSLYFYNYIPYRQGRDIDLARGGQKDFVKTQLLKSFYPYNFAQPAIRSYITDFYYVNQSHIYQNNDFKMIVDVILKGLDEVIATNSFDPRFYIRKAQILEEIGQKDSAFYKESEKTLREALKLASNRQEIWYALNLSLAKQGRFEEAISLSRKTIDLSPMAARPHFYLALLLSAENLQKNRDEILSELDRVKELNPGLNNLWPGDVKKMAEIYFNLKEYDRLVDLVTKRIDSGVANVLEPKYYELTLRYYLAKRDLQDFVKVANFIAKSYPETKDDMQSLIDLAQKGLWNILDTLP